MKKNCVKKTFAWLLAVLQLLACTSLAETIIEGVSTFSVSEFTGNYTVRFLDMNGDEVYQVTGVEYAALMDGPFAKLAEAHPEYETALWSVTGEYRVLNDTDVFMQPENAVAQVGDKVYLTLQAAIDAPETVEGSLILLLADTKESINTKGKSFTLNMGGHLLTAVNAGEHAYTQNGGNVLLMQGTITGKDFKGERENPGSGVLVDSNGTLTASYVTIENNKNDYGGGLRASGAVVALENCVIQYNSASGKSNGYGGGIYLNGSSTLTGSNLTVSNNSCLYYGGGVYAVDSTLNLESGCVVDSNKNEDAKYGYGAGIYMKGASTLTGKGLTISNNVSKSYGGGIFAKGGLITLTEGSSISGNQSEKQSGGAIYMYNGATLTGNSLTVSGNSCLYYGGGVYAADSTLNLESGCVVDSNKNEDADYGNGAGIYMKGASTLTGKGLTISNNVSKSYGGGIFANGGSINLTEGSSISGNQSEKQSGGAIYMYNGATLTGNSLTVSGNSCLYYGGGIYASGGTLKLENGCIVKGNWNTSADNGNGGGIYLTDSANLTGSGLTVSKNTAAYRGGGIYVDGTTTSNSTVTINSGSLFSENESKSDGGAIRAYYGTLSATDTVFEKNGSGGKGGAIFQRYAEAILTGCNFLQNKMNNSGAVYVSNINGIKISECHFTGNEQTSTASSYASALQISADSGDVTIKDSFFIGNKNGKTLILDKHNRKGDPASVTYTVFEDNKSSDYVFEGSKTVFENCKFTGNESSKATISTKGSAFELTFRNCKITGNTVTGTSGAAGIRAVMSSTITLESTTEIAGNEGGESGGILVDAGSTINVKSGTTIHNNTGNDCGGIYNKKGAINIEENTAVYDNRMGSVANDLRVAANQKIDTIEADQMKAADKDFEGYYWVDAKNGLPKWLRTDESGNEVFEAVPETLDAERFYTAMPYTAKPVAEVLRGNEEAKKYFSLAEAVLAAKDGDTVRLIYSEEKPENNTPVYESVEIAGKNITLNLNRRLLNAISGSAITVRADATLTLTGLPEEAAGETAHTVCGTMGKDVPVILNEGTLSIGKGLQTSWVRNQGTLTVGADAKCARVEHLGDALTVSESAEIERVEQLGGEATLDTTGKIGTVYLDKDKVVTAGSSFKPETLAFELDKEVLRQLNKGSTDIDNLAMVPLMAPKDSSVKFDDLLPKDDASGEDSQKKNKVTVIGANGYTTLKISEDGKLIACAEPLNGVYVDGQRGIDVEEGVLRGMSPEKPVKTFAKAKEILAGLLSARSIAAQDVKGIYVLGRIDVNSAEAWDMSDVPGKPENKLLMRYPTYTGCMIEVNSTLTLSNIMVDGGGGYGVKANAEMVSVNGNLNIESGAELRNNTRENGFGGAVCCQNGGTVTLNDGGKVTGSTAECGGGICVWDPGKLTMNGGEISGNTSSESGGGVALLVNNNRLSDYTEMMLLKGGKVTGNTGNKGGGIAVGGWNTAILGKALLTMEGGEVSDNTSYREGGGIYIQAEAKGVVSCGSIINNISRGGRQFGGGGGIYVNGERSLDFNTYSTGRLYLRNVIITDNTVNNPKGGDGGGLAVCNISNTKIYVGNGGAIYGNHCDPSPEIYIDDFKRSGDHGTPDARVSPYMLGGGEYNWKRPKGGDFIPLDTLAHINSATSLDNEPTNEAIAEARAQARVWITGNTALLFSGGGVASNGYVQIGDEPTSGKWTPEATKTLIGRDMKAGEFAFTVWENGTAVSHGKNVAPADGETEARIEFDPISYTNGHVGDKHTYIITEDETALPAVNGDSTEFKVEVTLVETRDGKLTGYVSSITTTAAEDKLDKVAFKNEYKAAKAELTVKKTITGQKPAKDAEFTFEAALNENQANAQYVVMPQPATVTVTGEGTAAFGSIAFEKAGEYAFTIKEVAGQAKGYTYDGVECQAIVKVTDTDGALKVESVSYSKNGKALEGAAAEFENPYAPAPVALKLPVSKTVQGQTPDNKIFTFELKAATENAPMPQASTITITGTGEAEFGEINYTQAGEWKYTVHELAGNEQYYTYDQQVYIVTVTVTDEDGSLKATWVTNRGVVEKLAFVNSYATPTPTPTATPTPTPTPNFTSVRVSKQWQDMDNSEGLRPQSVTIHLERSANGGAYEIVETINLTGEGNTWTHTFEGLPIRNADGAQYQYRVREEEVEGYAVQYDGYSITNVRVVATPTPIPTPTNVVRKPERAVDMKYEDGEWIWIDDMGVPLGVVATTGDDDNLTAVLVGMAMFLVGACGLVITLARKGKKKKA